MTLPNVDVLGVFRLPVSEELFREQFQIMYGDAVSDRQRATAEKECREQLESTVLIEVIVRNRDSRFDVGDFAQAQKGRSKDDWQVAWAETYLTSDGEGLLVKRWSDAPPGDSLRIAFFIHYWDASKPLQTSYGEVQCLAPQPMSERLIQLVPYEPVD